MAKFTDGDIDAIKQQVDLVALIGETVPLRASGTTQKGLCPFHDERTPSFTVNRNGFYHCFGCGAGGDVFTWLSEHEQMSFPDAVEYLADRAGVTLTRVEDSAEASQRAHRRELSRACTIAQEVFAQDITSGAAAGARAELTSRGFTGADAQAHGCGYAAGRAAEMAAVEAGISRDIAEQTGLAGGLFADRLMWPIHDPAGRLVGFAGRRLRDSDRGKYVNSPASPLFHKSQLLYRLHVAKKVAAQQGRIFVVEGYTDVMAVEKAGLAAVASCGTAFTADHVSVLTRALPDSVKVVFCLDGDRAGAEATVKAWQAAQGILDRCEAVLLPEADPCDLQAAGEDVAAALGRRVPLTQAVLSIVIDSHLDGTPEGQSRAVRAVVELLKSGANEIVGAGYREFIAERIGVSPAHVPVAGQASPPAPVARPTHTSRGLEQAFWEVVIGAEDFDAAQIAQPEWFTTAAAVELATLVGELEGPTGWVQRLFERVSDPLKPVVAGCAASGGTGDAEVLLRKVEGQYWARQAAAAQAQMSAPGADVAHWMSKWRDANQRAKRLRL